MKTEPAASVRHTTIFSYIILTHLGSMPRIERLGEVQCSNPKHPKLRVFFTMPARLWNKDKLVLLFFPLCFVNLYEFPVIPVIPIWKYIPLLHNVLYNVLYIFFYHIDFIHSHPTTDITGRDKLLAASHLYLRWWRWQSGRVFGPLWSSVWSGV